MEGCLEDVGAAQYCLGRASVDERWLCVAGRCDGGQSCVGLVCAPAPPQVVITIRSQGLIEPRQGFRWNFLRMEIQNKKKDPPRRSGAGAIQRYA